MGFPILAVHTDGKVSRMTAQRLPMLCPRLFHDAPGIGDRILQASQISICQMSQDINEAGSLRRRMLALQESIPDEMWSRLTPRPTWILVSHTPHEKMMVMHQWAKCST